MNKTISSPLQDYLLKNQFKLRITYIATYIPRKCGIATFTADLTKYINVLNPQTLCKIIAIADSQREPVTFPWEVAFNVEKERKTDYKKGASVADAISDIVCLQHEYGIFGGKDGEYVLSLIENLNKPLVTTFHTVLKDPSPHQKELLRIVADKSKACIVMIEEAAKRLKEVYQIPEEKIVIIPHGVPNIALSKPDVHKQRFGFSKKDFLIGSIILISENKGLEYVIEALPIIVKKIPNIKFLMIGETHPMVKLQRGESYRKSLQEKAVELGVSKNFVEVDKYISINQLIAYLQALDIYITPYLDLSQTASGTLSYAIGAGKCCISTDYIFAREVLAENRGILIPPKDSKAIAKAVIKIWEDPKLYDILQKNAYKYGRTMIWSRVALDYLNLFRFIRDNI